MKLQFLNVLDKIKTSGAYYEVLLLHDDNEILNLPWIMATDPHSGKQLGNIQQLLISKCLSNYFNDEERPPLPAPPLKILIMISSPEDCDYKDRLSFEEEELLILKAFEPLLHTGMVQIDFTDDGSLDALTRKIKSNKYHILHYSGHALFEDGEGYLILERPLDLKKEKVRAGDFADTLNCNPDYKIPMVVLSSCQTAKGNNEAGIRGATNHLLKIGIPAVISMGMAIQDRYAALFCARMYEELARRQNIISAFNTAVRSIRQLEFDHQARAGDLNPYPLQWIIPNLYRTGRIQHPIDWNKAKENLQFSSYKFIYEQDRLLLRHDKNYLFIGRRKDKARLMPPLFDKIPVMLKGQGGVGKTAMSEHLVQRLIAADSDTQPFLFNETIKSVNDIQKIVEDYLEEHKKLSRAELNSREKGLEQFKYLIACAADLCKPVFIFDNLESFQSKPNEAIAAEHQDIKDVIDYLCRKRNFNVILTGRYAIPDFSYVQSFDLNQVSINDFWKKCHCLELSKIAEYMQKNKMEKQLHEAQQKEELQFFDIVKLLHQTFGGNYRALEFFNELFKQKPDKIAGALDSLQDFRNKYDSETEEVKMKMSSNLIFSELLDLLDKNQQYLLSLMAHFRIPVQQFAVRLQLGERNEFNNYADLLFYLHDLTLLEISMDPEAETIYFYSTPIVKDLLGTIQTDISPLPFSHQKAGIYYYYSNSRLEPECPKIAK